MYLTKIVIFMKEIYLYQQKYWNKNTWDFYKKLKSFMFDSEIESKYLEGNSVW